MDDDGLVFIGKGQAGSPRTSPGYDPVKGLEIVTEAESWEGTPKAGPAQPPIKRTGGDGSAITEQVLRQTVDPDFQRSPDEGQSLAKAIATSQDLRRVPDGLSGALPGDLLIWEKNAKGPDHVAIFAGECSYNGTDFNQVAWTSRTGNGPFALVPLKWFRQGDPPRRVLRNRVAAGE